MGSLIDSGYAWRRLLASVIISTMGGIGMWALAVAMPAVQIDLGVTRARLRLSPARCFRATCLSALILPEIAGAQFSQRLVCGQLSPMAMIRWPCRMTW